MEKILVLTFVDDAGTLGRAQLEAVAAGVEMATALGAPLTIGIWGGDTDIAVRQVAGTGARLLAASGEEFAQALYATDAAACEALCRAAEATLVLAPSASRTTRMMAGVASRMKGFIDTHITALGVEGEIEASRWYYRQRIESKLRRTSRPWFLLLESGTREPYAGAPSDATAEAVAVTLPALRSTVVGVRAPKQDEQTIRPDAKLLFVAGAGWTKKQADGQAHPDEAGRLILGFLKAADASLGSSKSLVDQSGENQAVLQFMTHMNQIGQTGATPRHPKGLSTCCHGEEPHVVGWRFINERRAINLDPNCGWARGKADVLYVADAFKVVAKLNELLGEKK